MQNCSKIAAIPGRSASGKSSRFPPQNSFLSGGCDHHLQEKYVLIDSTRFKDQEMTILHVLFNTVKNLGRVFGGVHPPSRVPVIPTL